MPSFKLTDVTLGYDGHSAIHHLDGKISSGSLTAIVGPNGAGKSTLIRGLSGILKPMGGQIVLTGCVTREVAYLPQASEIDHSFPASVEDLVMLGLWQWRGMFGTVGNSDRERLHKALVAVGLGGFQSRPIGTLSGGQLQRALFARVLLQDAKVILLDEPFTAIDAKTVSDLIALIQRWHREERTIIAVLHDMDLVREHFPETVLLARKPVAWGQTAQVLSAENLLKARRMNEAWDDAAPWCEKGAA